MKKRVLLTPIDLSAVVTKTAGVFEKQILPLGSINYKGRKITFDRKYLTDLAESFREGAYDQVPLVYATPENAHNLDPKNFGGEIVGFKVHNDGLYARIKADAQTRKVLARNPRLGVSARIVEGLEKSDGRTFDRAIQHVLLTMDPRVTGMKPWRTVDLSGYNGATQRVVDLTALTIKKESEMPRKTAAVSRSVKAKAKTREPASNLLDLSTLTDSELDILLAATAPVEAPAVKKSKKVTETVEEPVDEADDDEVDPDDIDDEDDEDSEDDDESDDEDDESDDDEVEAEDDEEVDESEDLAVPSALADALGAEKASRNAKPKGKKKAAAVPPVTNLSSKVKRRQAIDLAAGALDGGDRESLQAMREEIAEERWTNRRKQYIRDGVPPFLLDLAAPLLSSPDAAVIDLSTSDESINATEILGNVLDGVKGLIDLRPEIGHRIDLSDDGQPEGEAKALLTAWENGNY